MGIKVDYIWNETMESTKDVDSVFNFYHTPTCPLRILPPVTTPPPLASLLKSHFCHRMLTSCLGFLKLHMLILVTHQNDSWNNLHESFQCLRPFSSTAPLFYFLLSSLNSHFKLQNSTAWPLRIRSIHANFKNIICPWRSFSFFHKMIDIPNFHKMPLISRYSYRIL